MFITFESNFPHPDRKVAEHDTFEEAFGALKASPDCVFAEEDADNEGCADAFMIAGEVYCIEPADRCAHRFKGN